MSHVQVGQILVAAVTALLIGVMVAQTAPAAQEFATQSADWCDDHHGDLVHAKSISHGGLHCELPNGTSVHMNEVITDAD